MTNTRCPPSINAPSPPPAHQPVNPKPHTLKQVTVFGSGLIGAALTCHFGRNPFHSAPARLLGPHTVACASPLTNPGAVAFALSYRNAAGGDIEVRVQG